MTLLVAGAAGALAPSAAYSQRAAQGDYYEICRRLGFIPGTTPMRRCIQIQRDTDLDPMSALSDYKLAPKSAAPKLPLSDPGGANFSGADSARKLLDSSPEELLLGPDYRSQGQGIYE